MVILVSGGAGSIAECRVVFGKAGYGIADMCVHSWNRQSKNPDGYQEV